MDPKILKDTQDSLGKIIKKPPLTEKLLTKPPFRFLHDIMTSVVRSTGFMQGLFTDDELNSENVKDKDSKMAFLQKVIDIVALVSGKQLHVKTSKIVAGHEADKTNLLLQCLADSINKNVNNDNYVQKVLGRHKNGDDRGKENNADKQKEKERTHERVEGESDKTKGEPEKRSRGKESTEGGKDRQGSKERDRTRPREGSNEKREPGTREHKSEREPGSKDQKPERGRGEGEGDGETREGESRREHRSSRKVPAAQKSPTKPQAKSKTTPRPGDPSEKTTTKSPPKPQPSTSAPKQKASSTTQKQSATPSSSAPTIRQKNTPSRNAVQTKKSSIKKSSSDATKIVAESKTSPSRVASRQAKHRKEKEEGEILKKEQPLTRDDIQPEEQPVVVNGNDTEQNKEGTSMSQRKMERPSSAKGSRRRRDGRNAVAMDTGKEEVVAKQLQQEAAAESLTTDYVPPQTLDSRLLLRPNSARPAPPQVKKQEAVPDEPAMRLGSGRPTHVIVDNDQSDDDEFFLVEETKLPVTEPDTLKNANTAMLQKLCAHVNGDMWADLAQKILDGSKLADEIKTDEDLEEGDHGGLVKKILETKKELEGGNLQTQAKKTEIERPAINDATRRKERDQVQKEVDKLRGCIQGLTRSANPLGKIMDYVQEDLDAMQVELKEWTTENAQHALSLKREQGITNKAIEPLKVHLKEIDTAIGDQLEKIVAIKSNIFSNDQKIDKMLRSVNKS